MASAEMEFRSRTMPNGIRSPHAAEDPLDGTMVVSDYAYFKLQAIEHLNCTLCSPDTGKLSAANICAIMFLLWAEVGSPLSSSPILSCTMSTDSDLLNSGTAGIIRTFTHIYPA